MTSGGGPSPLAVGMGCHAAGRLAEAEAAYRRALAEEPGRFDALHLFGLVAGQTGRPDVAVVWLRRAADRHGASAVYYSNLGVALRRAERLDEAIAACRRAADIDPAFVDAGVHLANLALERRLYDEAAEALRRVVRARPDVAARRPAPVRAPSRRDGEDEVERILRAAIALSPEEPGPWEQAARRWLGVGERRRALPYARRVARLAPDARRSWSMLGESLRGVRLDAEPPGLRHEILEALDHPGVDRRHLTAAALSLLEATPEVKALYATPDDAPAPQVEAVVRGLAGSRLLIGLLEATIVPDGGFERALTRLRRGMLSLVAAGTAFDPGWLDLSAALADQSFLAEYVWAETPEETAAAARLEAALAATLDRGAAPEPSHVALLAAYRPLVAWPKAAALAARTDWPPALAALLRRQVREPADEATLAVRIETLTPIDDPVSRAVRAQYEENPYPRWRRIGLDDAPVPARHVLRSQLPDVEPEPGPWWDAPEILVAGCGTGREAAWIASRFAGARVLAVDLSRASLAYARRRAEALGLDNLSFAQADILALGGLERRFDMIHSMGVLHHMAEPEAGWRALRGLLRPHGLMKIGLYSRHARAPVAAARARIAAQGHPPTLEGIRAMRGEVLAAPAGHPLAPLRTLLDFYGASPCRDLLFHAQEHRTTLPELAELLDRLGLEFLGFHLDDAAVAERYRARFPDDSRMTDLSNWDLFERDEPGTFFGLYQFWVRLRPERRAL